jgi:hypothetical protein
MASYLPTLLKMKSDLDALIAEIQGSPVTPDAPKKSGKAAVSAEDLGAAKEAGKKAAAAIDSEAARLAAIGCVPLGPAPANTYGNVPDTEAPVTGPIRRSVRIATTEAKRLLNWSRDPVYTDDFRESCGREAQRMFVLLSTSTR